MASSGAESGADAARPSSQHRARSRTPPPRPTTPLRPPSRSSLRSSHTPTTHGAAHAGPSALDDALEPAFAELADGMADLEANLVHVQIMHESLARFNECFAAFLHGLKVNAFCVDFPEAPVRESYARAPRLAALLQRAEDAAGMPSTAQDVDQTFLYVRLLFAGCYSYMSWIYMD